MGYKKIKTKKGLVRWLKDGRFVSPKDVPEEIKSFSISEKKPVKCLFCNQKGDKIRSLFMPQTKERKEVKLCEDHYYEKSLGKILEQIRKEAK